LFETVSAIIPTLGRKSLARAVSSALNQSLPIHEVIVVDASENGITPEELPNNGRVKIVRTVKDDTDNGHLWTAAVNRNIGVKNATGTYVAFLDDDDVWLPKKSEQQIMAATSLQKPLILGRVHYKLGSGVQYTRPRKPIGREQNVFEAMYGTRMLRQLPYYLATPTILALRDFLVDVPLPELVPGYEDTLWLHQAQQAGAQIWQISEIVAVVSGDPKRSIGRDTLSKNKSWADTLSETNSRYAHNFLSGIAARNAVINGSQDDVSSLRSLASIYLSESDLSIFESVRWRALELLAGFTGLWGRH